MLRRGNTQPIIRNVSNEELTELGGGEWQTPSPFDPDTLAVFANGQLIASAPINGYTITGTDTFQFKTTRRPSMRVSAYYVEEV